MGTTAEKLTYLNTTKQLIKESINLTDANITNEPFRQYATILKHRLPEIVGDPSIIWNNYEHVTGSGTSFSITAYNSIIDYKLKGDTTQNGTPTPDAPVPVNTVTGDQVISVNSTQYPISLGIIELCKIPNTTYQDYIYKDNGVWYLHKEIGKVVLDGSRNWIKSASTSVDRFIEQTTRTDINIFNGLSNYFIYNQDSSNVGTFFLDNSQNQFRGRIITNFSSYGTTTLEQFKNWLSTHNAIVYYVLATPTNTEITDVNLIYQLNGVSLITGLNNISVSGNLPATLDLTALKYE